MRALPLVLLSALAAWSAPEPDAALLERIERLRRTAQQSGPQLWPGWDPTATPLLIFKGTEMAVLVEHPSPPAAFRKVETTAVSAPVFIAESTTGFIRANTAQNIGGVLTSTFSYDDFMGKPLPDALALGLHELFHAHYARIAPKKHANILIALWGEYPEFSARNRALLALEGEMLRRAIAAGKVDEVRRETSGFVGLRLERRKDLSPELAAYEAGEESSEGIARYIEYKVLKVLNTPDALAKRLEPLQKLNALERDRERFYALGMAQALVLDRLQPGWKTEFESGPALVEDLLRAAAPPVSDVRTLMDQLDFNRVHGEQQRAGAERQAEGTRRLTGFLGQPGDRIVVEIAAITGGIRLRGFNPNGSMPLTPEQTAHPFLLLDLGAETGAQARLEFRGAPIIYDRVQDILWFVAPADAVAAAVKAFASAAGESKLAIKGQGFSAEFSKVEMERRGRELRIRPAKDLKRAPPPPKPEFVRPEQPIP